MIVDLLRKRMFRCYEHILKEAWLGGRDVREPAVMIILSTSRMHKLERDLSHRTGTS